MLPPKMGDRFIWNRNRQLLGNIIPIVFAAVIAFLFKRLFSSVDLIAALILFVVTTWLFMNQFGLWENNKIEKELREKLKNNSGEFVGFATPKEKGLLDPHFDVGILHISEDMLSYSGERISIRIPLSEIRDVYFVKNAHSLVFLGGYMAVITKNATLYFECRRHKTLLGNLKTTKKLISDLCTRLDV